MSVASTKPVPSFVTMEEAGDQFTSWRQSKSHKFEPIPSHLKDLVKILLKRHSKHKIVKFLRISYHIVSAITKSTDPFLYPHSSAKRNKEQDNALSNDSCKSKRSKGRQYYQQPFNFIPFQITQQGSEPILSTSSNRSIAPVSSTLAQLQDGSFSCKIIRPGGFELIIRTSDLKPVIQNFLCSS